MAKPQALLPPGRPYVRADFHAPRLTLAGLNAWVFHAGIWRKVAAWDRDAVAPFRARLAGGFSLFLWACIVVSGRMIAYNWFNKVAK